MLKSKIFFFASLLFLLYSCSSEPDEPEKNRISPSRFLLGTWISPTDPIKITFTSDNIIEENINYVDQFWTTDFKKEFSSDEFEVEETILDDETNGKSYSITVIRKDGNPINQLIGNTTIDRKYTKVNFQGQESILLSFLGYTGLYLFKE